MTLSIEDLDKYNQLQLLIENRAEKVLKELYKHRKWNFPKDFSLNRVDISELESVCIFYYGFMTNDSEVVPIEYFLTLDPKTLDKKEEEI